MKIIDIICDVLDSIVHGLGKLLCKLNWHDDEGWVQYRKNPGHYRQCNRCKRKQKYNKSINRWVDIWKGLS